MKAAPNPLNGSFTVNVAEGSVPVIGAFWLPDSQILSLACTITQPVTAGYIRMIGDDPGLENTLDIRAVPVLARKFHNPMAEPSGPMRHIVMRMLAYLRSQGLVPPGTLPPWAHIP